MNRGGFHRPHRARRLEAYHALRMVTAALARLWAIDGIQAARRSDLGVAICLPGMGVIMLAPRD